MNSHFAAIFFPSSAWSQFHQLTWDRMQYDASRSNQLMISKPKILRLSLYAQWFKLILKGNKTIEYREIKQWSTSLLHQRDGTKKNFDFILFTNGYGNNRPWMKIEFKGFYKTKNVVKRYSDGSVINIQNQEMYAIKLGRILEAGNLSVLK